MLISQLKNKIYIKEVNKIQKVEEKKAGIYSLVNTLNGFRYIDYSYNLELSIKNLIRKLNYNGHPNLRLQLAWNVFGNYFNTEILEYVEDKDQLPERKKYWINYYRSNEIDHGYNLELLKRPWEEEREKFFRSNKWLVDDNLSSVLKDIISQLNYELKYAKDRLNLLNGLLTKERIDWLVDYFSSPNFIKKQIKNKNSFLAENDSSLILLSILADYLVFPKYINEELEFKENEIKLRKSKVNMTYGNEKREILVSEPEEIEKLKEKVAKAATKNKANKKQKVTKKDIKEIEYIRQIYESVNKLNKLLKNKNISPRNRHVIKKTVSELKKDAVLIKDQIRGTIYFKKPLKESTVYNFDCDTGYFADKYVNGQIIYGDYVEISKNKINFKNKKHIFGILDNYSALKEASSSKIGSDLWYLLLDFEELVKSTKFEDHEKVILLMKIEGYRYDEISDYLKNKYGMDLNPRKVSKIYRKTIPQKIAEQYEQQYEDWLYTFKVKGTYKKCAKCGEIKLALPKYFSPSKQNKDGLHTYCRSCRQESK